jgi:hypothetical protein
VMFSALIHHADHRGVPNRQLAKEAPNLARVYKNKGIAEQNSVDISWDLFNVWVTSMTIYFCIGIVCSSIL